MNAFLKGDRTEVALPYVSPCCASGDTEQVHRHWHTEGYITRVLCRKCKGTYLFITSTKYFTVKDDECFSKELH